MAAEIACDTNTTVEGNKPALSRRSVLLAGSALAAASAIGGTGSHAQAQTQTEPAAPPAGKPPNILVIWGDDIGIWNISFNSRGMMGYRTPNIDRIAEEG